MEKRTILFVYKGHFSYLPPFQALVEALLSTKKYKLKVICSEEEPDMDECIRMMTFSLFIIIYLNHEQGLLLVYVTI